MVPVNNEPITYFGEGIIVDDLIEQVYFPNGSGHTTLRTRRVQISRIWLNELIDREVTKKVSDALAKISEDARKVAGARVEELFEAMRASDPEHAQALAVILAAGEGMSRIRSMNEKESQEKATTVTIGAGGASGGSTSAVGGTAVYKSVVSNEMLKMLGDFKSKG